MSKHAPLPWKLSLTDDTMIIDATGREVCAIDGDYNSPDDWPIMEANAAHIVHCVNTYPILVEVLKRADVALASVDECDDAGYLEITRIKVRAALEMAGAK